MLSNEFSTILIDEISVHRDARMRQTVKDDAISELAESISRLGLIHPIVLDQENVLVAGETRLSACKALGWTHIPFQRAETLNEHDLLSIEIEENVKRRDVDWRDKCLSLNRLHNLYKEINGEWSQGDTAKAIGYTQSTVSEMLAVATHLSSGNVRVTEAPKYSVARGIVARANQRAAADQSANIMADIMAVEEGPKGDEILVEDFNEWACSYSGVPFNFIHCDFPYGIGHDNFNQGSAAALGGYEDSEENYWKLVWALTYNKERLLGDSGHILFWFSMRHYQKTLEALSKEFWVDPYPLLWVKSDNVGTLPDYQRGPRRVYEAAFWCSVGDRKIITAVGNAFYGPNEKIVGHTSEKSISMLKHFFRMTVDGDTRMLDPTCGSGSALRAAKEMGAASVLGLEVNPGFAEDARRALKR
jgi:ParB/RepB/Spo0J family partition protein